MYFLDINDLEWDSDVKEYCNKQDIERITCYSPGDERMRRLGSIIIQKDIITDYIEIPNKDIILDYSKMKPFAKGHPNIKYNIAHDKDMVVGVTSNNNVGIDILSNDCNIDLLDDSFWDPIEIGNIRSGKTTRNILWTQIEAYIKCIGNGIELLEERDFYINNDMIIVNGSVSKKYQLETHIYQGYIISVCYEMS